ncbi:MAG: magnesium transporter [Ignavibacteriales bacterium]|nr:magnesium transporter [Ignavibacteriales bacterium]
MADEENFTETNFQSEQAFQEEPEAFEKNEVLASPTLVEVDDELITEFRELIQLHSVSVLTNLLLDLYPADIAHLINRLNNDEAGYLFNLLDADAGSQVITMIDETHRTSLYELLGRNRLSSLINKLDSDDATDLVSEMPALIAEQVLEGLDKPSQSEVQELLQYDPSTAGGIMAKEFLAVQANDTVHRAIQAVRKAAKTVKDIFLLFVVDESGKIVGEVQIKDLLLHTPNRRIRNIMNRDVITANVFLDQEEVARLFKKYDLVVLPVVRLDGTLVGKITVDDVVDVMEEEASEDMYRMVGSDASEIEKKSPFDVAKMRIPWLLASMGLSLCSGIIISFFNETLTRVILLASFMPVISAISGNTGLQAAVIITRGLALGYISPSQWRKAWWKEMRTVGLMAIVCAIVLGFVASLWSKHLSFGVVVGSSMFLSMSTAGTMGTLMPLLSKRLGFDPAITAGPFETTFQDVIGISIFLGLSTYLLSWISS